MDLLLLLIILLLIFGVFGGLAYNPLLFILVLVAVLVIFTRGGI